LKYLFTFSGDFKGLFLRLHY